MTLAYTLIVIGSLMLGASLVVIWFAGLARINHQYDVDVIHRSREPNLEDSASNPPQTHPRPAAVVSAAGPLTQQAGAFGIQPTAAGSSFPPICPPDEFDIAHPDSRLRLASLLNEASTLVSVGLDEQAHDKALLAAHVLACVLHERRADQSGVVR